MFLRVAGMATANTEIRIGPTLKMISLKRKEDRAWPVIPKQTVLVPTAATGVENAVNASLITAGPVKYRVVSLPRQAKGLMTGQSKIYTATIAGSNVGPVWLPEEALSKTFQDQENRK